MERKIWKSKGNELFCWLKTPTSFYSIKDDMINAGTIWPDEPVVCDGRIITSRKPEDLPFFCREIISALSK
jgi:protease I